MSGLTVFSIKAQDEGESKWVQVGKAFVNRDSSINVYLDVLPIDGKLHIRPDKTEVVSVDGSLERYRRIETALRVLVREQKLGREPLADDWLKAQVALEEP